MNIEIYVVLQITDGHKVIFISYMNVCDWVDCMFMAVGGHWSGSKQAILYPFQAVA